MASYCRFFVSGYGVLETDLTPPSGNVWNHIVLNYLGRVSGQGIRIYYNGVLTGSDTTSHSGTFSDGPGRVLVGRWAERHAGDFAGVDLDEILMFNESLTQLEINTLV